MIMRNGIQCLPISLGAVTLLHDECGFAEELALFSGHLVSDLDLERDFRGILLVQHHISS